jgi:hypothetical protein
MHILQIACWKILLEILHFYILNGNYMYMSISGDLIKFVYSTMGPGLCLHKVGHRSEHRIDRV